MQKLLRFFIAVAFLALPAVSTAIDMEPAPADRGSYKWRKEPGELKHNKFGVLDPSPDVVSLEYLPKDGYGFVDWTRAIRDGVIAPRETLEVDATEPAAPPAVGNVVIKSKMDFMPDVLFPHEPHTEWLKCSTCHPKIFKPRAGGNPITMSGIWKGEFCGRCHDKVAFPTRNCFRCHSVPRGK